MIILGLLAVVAEIAVDLMVTEMMKGRSEDEWGDQSSPLLCSTVSGSLYLIKIESAMGTFFPR
jgi:hypothetical protein